MAVNCGVSFGVCTVRLTALNADGSVKSATNNSYVTDKTISVAVNPNIDTGQTFTARSGCGCRIASFKANNIFNWLDLVYTGAAEEPILHNMLTGDTPIVNGADTVGTDSVGALDCSTPLPFVALEFWTEHVVGSGQDGAYPWIHWVIPKTTWSIGNNTYAEAIGQPVYDGYSQTNALWGHGPYGDGPPDGQQVKEYAYWKTATSPPAAACASAHVVPSS